jgi:hypothetical protein
MDRLRPEAIVPVENIARINGRGLFLSILEKEMLLTGKKKAMPPSLSGE